ncbi:MAG: helix-turn-helix domain-containing protein [Candidatus Nealsonbacteria bacterium]
MGYAGKLKLKLKAKELRKKGLSVKTIQKRLGVSRSSVSLWVRDIQLTRKQLERLYLNKKTGALRGSIIAAMNATKRRRELTRKLIAQGKKEIGNISKRDRFIAGIALYLGEGSKTDGDVSFSNSNPEAMKFMVSWFRAFCKAPEKRLRGSLYIHSNLDEKKSKRFWSEITEIPLSQFTKSYIVKNNPHRLRKTKHIYGVFRVKISDVNLHRKIMGWIKGVI